MATVALEAFQSVNLKLVKKDSFPHKFGKSKFCCHLSYKMIVVMIFTIRDNCSSNNDNHNDTNNDEYSNHN